jgi:hypothetical protein
MSMPSTAMSPLVGLSAPSRMASVVVLPAPLPPSSAVIEPRATVKETSSTATSLSKRFTTCATAIAGVAAAGAAEGWGEGIGA